MDRDYGDIRVGDSVSFARAFSAADFATFAGLSGDRNPLHHDAGYSARSGLGRPILPAFLASAPLSAVAGMFLPGHRSLILSSQVRSLEPVDYGREVTYSAKVVAKSDANRTITVRAIAFAGPSVLLEGQLQVRVRDDVPAGSWSDAAEPVIEAESSNRTALVTGATGEIGRAVCLKLSRSGWRTILHHRGDPGPAERLAQECRALGADPLLLGGSLETAGGRRAMVASLASLPAASALVHAASPALDAPAAELLEVNYSALRDLAAALLPGMLRRQRGRVVLIGSSATQYLPAGWEDYVAAKVAATSYVLSLHRRYSGFGVAGSVVAPGYVLTRFSESHRPADADCLLPEEVAEAIADDLAGDALPQGGYLWMGPGFSRRGGYGFFEAAAPAPARRPAPDGPPADDRPSTTAIGRPPASDLDQVIRGFFGLSGDADLAGAGLDLTPGWNSLRHIELLLQLEAAFGLRFSSQEISETAHYQDLQRLIDARRTPPPDSHGPAAPEIPARPTPEELAAYFDRLWPIMRSLTGDGVRRTHDILGELAPLRRIEVPSGTRCFDWTVPREWVCREAYVVTPDGRRILDIRENNLHLLNASVPFRGRLGRGELDRHLYSLPGSPRAIPYRTSYYEPRWGFCLTQEMRDGLPEGEYEVVVDTDHVNGSMTISEVVLPGDEPDEVLISTYTCHPSMANNELSGPLVAAFLCRSLMALPRRRLTYRFVWLPETIGSIAYLARHGEHLKSRLAAGYVASCVGDDAPFTYKRSRRGDTVADRAALYTLRRSGGEAPRVLPFDPLGSDERQYCSPGFDLPVGVIARSIYGRYAEYHTSFDDRDFISFEAMAGSVDAYFATASLLDENLTYSRTSPSCEPQLGRRGLYPTLGSTVEVEDRVTAMMWLLNLADGGRDLLAIAERSGANFWLLDDVAQACLEAGLIERAAP